MINREHGYKHETITATYANIYHSPVLYAESMDDYGNPAFEELIDFCERWMERGKMQFPNCTFEIRTTGIHDSDFRIYAEIMVRGRDCSEATEWLVRQSG